MGLKRETRRLATKLRRLLSFVVKKKATPQAREQCRLIMTLLIRNEADILNLNLAHHYAQGVDFVIVTDHLSTDNTSEILAPYIAAGKLHVIKETGEAYLQDMWVNRMAQLAVDKYGADFIFHCDADEFWNHPSGNLKDELLKYPLVDCLMIRATNILLEDKDTEETFPENAIYEVHNPMGSHEVLVNRKDRCLYLYKSFYKVFFRARKTPRVQWVENGNHALQPKDRRQQVIVHSKEIFLWHFPIRGKEHFYRKVSEGGAAIEKSDEPENIAWHWRYWYGLYKEGKLLDAYGLQVLKNDSLEMIKANVVRVNREPARYLTKLKSRL